MTGALPLALTMGEPAGIGGEITGMAWRAVAERGGPPFFVVHDPGYLRRLGERLGTPVPLIEIHDPSEATAAFPSGLPVLPLGMSVAAEPGHPDPANGCAVLASIQRAYTLVAAGRAGAMVTNPIQKSALYATGFKFPGHTEYLADLAGSTEAPVMMLAGGWLRVVLATIHLSLRDAIAALTTEGIVHVGRVTAAALRRDFGLTSPRLAVAALNPHAGESGSWGDEEARVITPAVARLRAEGFDVTGPQPADTLFHAGARRRFDAVVCMYHDQGLIPLKTIAFDSGVNVTLGLPIVRTSPDHGTALDLAGTNQAKPDSLIAAIDLAAEMAAARRGDHTIGAP